MLKEIQRDFIIGDEWLYYKIFCGHSASNKILTEILKPLSEEFLAEKLIKQWFFIRYNNPSYHIRYRVQITDIESIGYIIKKINVHLRNFISNELIWTVEVDTYKREIERYGRNTMLISENIFYLDSCMVSNFIESLNNEETYTKSLFGLRLMKFYLDSFDISLHEKLKFTESLKNSFYKEFSSEKDIKKQLDKLFNDNQATINTSLSSNINKSNSLTKSIFPYKKEIQKNIRIITALQKKNALEIDIYHLISSYIHMSVNRLFISNNRLHELTLYDFLWRHYKKVYFKSINS
ncbi:thiopeptide-type bacteriocin biosynthesis protein [Chryseobacterium tongliaoense]|uniref:thiopeptide-type bacteriocin biosynthesis protein n=1 Tax=Chryseobacterium tongliaoense TaxID=3240933 RepID=UPI003510F204